MTSHQDRRAGRSRRDEVEDVLALVPGATAAEADALVALFAGAAGPISPGEIAGEEAAVAAFRAAHAPAAGPSRTSKIRATVLTVKAAAAALVLTSLGGVALAATTDVLPAPLTIGHDAKPSIPSDSRGSTDGTVADPAQTAAVRNAAQSAAAADRADAKAGREKSYAGLCKAFTAGAGDNAKVAGNPAFSRLVAAAPQGDVAGFCAALAAEAPAARTPAGKGAKKAKPPAARDQAVDNDRSAEAREKVAENGKAAEAVDKSADKGKSDVAPKGPQDDAPRGKPADTQRPQLSR